MALLLERGGSDSRRRVAAVGYILFDGKMVNGQIKGTILPQPSEHGAPPAGAGQGATAPEDQTQAYSGSHQAETPKHWPAHSK
jgi:hypothetical protein